ncbi:MAG: hypothetical protein LBU18_06155 [Treponema sp.]|nr:hypothetical protein [Treponema sp.]
MSLTSAFLYCAGVRLRFIDANQIMLLRICALSALILLALSMYGIVLNLWFLVRRGKRLYIPGAAAYFLAAVFGGLTASAAVFILALAGGNKG